MKVLVLGSGPDSGMAQTLPTPRSARTVKRKNRKVAILPQRGSTALKTLLASCRGLLSERGESSYIPIAQRIFAAFCDLDDAQRTAFFHRLASDFSPDPEAVVLAAQKYRDEGSHDALDALLHTCEPPRQELFRRLNRAPGGTRRLISMREHVLKTMNAHPPLRMVEADLLHLLSSWFNPGFLNVVRIDWKTPAYLLEQIIAHEAVHEIRGWGDLRRRLESDRRCFALFHPTLLDEPLIFVEVAFSEQMPEAVAPLLEDKPSATDLKSCRTAVFYSINACQPGLRGISLGNHLIKEAVRLLTEEIPQLKTFCTLSPVPGFVGWLKRFDSAKFGESEAGQTLAKYLSKVREVCGADFSLVSAHAETAAVLLAPVEHPLRSLCVAYLLGVGELTPISSDPVARFHLSNGAQLARVNWGADWSAKGIKQSLSLMVNYHYEMRHLERNHLAFIAGNSVISKAVVAANVSG